MKKNELVTKVQELSKALIKAYEDIKYTEVCSANEFIIVQEEYDTLEQLINAAKANENWQNPPFPFILPMKNLKLKLKAVANPILVRDEFLKLISNPELKKEVQDILTDKRLAQEAANEFLNAYSTFKDDKAYELESFLRRYDIKSSSFVDRRKGLKGSYYFMLDRLVEEFKGDWQKQFLSLLDEKLGDRIESLLQQINKNGVIDEDKLNLMERLAAFRAIGLVENLGLEAYDVLVAMYGEKNFPKTDRQVIAELFCDGRGIRYFLGRCRKERASTDTIYDWAAGLLKKVSKHVDVTVYKKKPILQSILVNMVISKYVEQFGQDKQATIDQIAADMSKVENSVEKAILNTALEHYKLMARCSQLSGVSRTIKVVSTYK